MWPFKRSVHVQNSSVYLKSALVDGRVVVQVWAKAGTRADVASLALAYDASQATLADIQGPSGWYLTPNIGIGSAAVSMVAVGFGTATVARETDGLLASFAFIPNQSAPRFQASLSGVVLSNTGGMPVSIGTIPLDFTWAVSPAVIAIAATSAIQLEGNTGSTAYTFTVSRTGYTGQTSTAVWQVEASPSYISYMGGVDSISVVPVEPVSFSDFVGGALPTGTVSFAAGESSKTITVLVAGDSTVEPYEGFTVLLSNASSGTTISTATATGIIQNDDASLAITATDAVKSEGNTGSTTYTFTVTRSGYVPQASTANWAVAGSGTNQAVASDFVGGVLPMGTVSFAAGETSKTITVLVAGDSAVESDEGFTVSLSNASSGTAIGTTTALGVVVNDDASLAIAATSARKLEGNSGSTPFTFTVTRSGNTSATHSVNWAVSAGSVAGTLAAVGSDFTGGVLPSGVVTFSSGETSKTITVQVVGDNTNEFNESFAVSLSNASAGAAIGTASAQGVIFNDDARLNLAATPVAKPEGNTGSTAYTFTAARLGYLDQQSTANWAVAGSGTNPAVAADFVGGVLPTGTVSFAAGETSKTITVLVAGDSVVESDEGFTVSLSNASASTAIGTATATGTILDDDPIAIQTQANRALAISELNGTWNVTPAASYGFGVTGSPDDAKADVVKVLDSGRVVGNFSKPNGDLRAAIWDRGVLTDLGTLGGASTTALDANFSGYIVGKSQISTGDWHAFVYRDGVMYDLGAPGGSASSAWGINDNGLIVGGVSNGGNDALTNLTFWDRGQAISYGYFGGSNINIFDINNNGFAVGLIGYNGPWKGFVFDFQNGGHYIVGDFMSAIWDINDSNIGVGYMNGGASGHDTTGISWTSTTGLSLEQLNAADDDYSQGAWAINELGQRVLNWGYGGPYQYVVETSNEYPIWQIGGVFYGVPGLGGGLNNLSQIIRTTGNDYAVISPEHLGLSSPTLSFLGTPDMVTLPSAGSTVAHTMTPEHGVAVVDGFTVDVDSLVIDLAGAANTDLVGFDTTLNGQHAIALANKYNLGQGVVLVNMPNDVTATDLLANHVIFSGGKAYIG